MVTAYRQGDVVRYTGAFLRSIGMHAGGPVDGLVIGRTGPWLVVAWSDGRTTGVHPNNIERRPDVAGRTGWLRREACRMLHAWRAAERAAGGGQ